MFQPPPNPFEGSRPNPFAENGIPDDPIFQRLPDHASIAEPVQQGKVIPELRKIYFILIGVGLTLGLLVSIAVLRVINHFGLSDVPERSAPTTELVNPVNSTPKPN